MTATTLADRGRFSRLAALLTALTLVLCLCACGAEDPICGSWICTGGEADGLQVYPWQLPGAAAVLTLSADGRGTLSREGQEGDLTWLRSGERLDLNIGGRVYSASIEGDVILLETEPGLCLCFEREEELSGEAAEPEYPSWDWYGWWSTEDSSGKMPNTWYDCFARLEDGAYGPILRIWDEASSYDAPLAMVRFRWDGEDAVSESGWFLQDEIEEGQWRLRPGELLELTGRCVTEEESFGFRLHLRRWGSIWPASEERLPLGYKSWYLPLRNRGVPMPERMGTN